MKGLYLVYVRQLDDNRRGFVGEVRANSEEEAFGKARTDLKVTAPEDRIDILRGVPEVEHQVDQDFTFDREEKP